MLRAAPSSAAVVSSARAGHRDLVALAGIAHVERALDADLLVAQTRRARSSSRACASSRANMAFTSSGVSSLSGVIRERM